MKSLGKLLSGRSSSKFSGRSSLCRLDKTFAVVLTVPFSSSIGHRSVFTVDILPIIAVDKEEEEKDVSPRCAKCAKCKALGATTTLMLK